MFEDLYDAISLWFSWRWPSAEGEITAVDVDTVQSSGRILRLAVSYKFFVSDDGPYTGVCYWQPLSVASVLDAKESLRVGQVVTVRFRRDNPGINTLDRRLWQDF